MYQFFFITDFNIIVRRYIKKIAQKIGIVAFASFPLFTKVVCTYIQLPCYYQQQQQVLLVQCILVQRTHLWVKIRNIVQFRKDSERSKKLYFWTYCVVQNLYVQKDRGATKAEAVMLQQAFAFLFHFKGHSNAAFEDVAASGGTY